MARLIDADALIEAMELQNCKKYGNNSPEEVRDSYETMMRYEIKDAIDDAPTVDAVEVVSTVEAVVAGWGAEPGEVAEVGAKARTQFHEPPVGRRGFPDFAAFCAGYGAGCGQCRFFHHGKGPFCMVWAEACSLVCASSTLVKMERMPGTSFSSSWRCGP